ncbi:hypothetical protein BGZ46_009941 [Entomortierella lignicola]|nr:hypothetical protein BGZ46_009941 [Entomortierella lignicola]
MAAVQSKLLAYRSLIPDKYVKRIKFELQTTFLVALSLLRTHRRKALLLSLGPATILKFITVMLPIIKLLPMTINALKTLSYFTTKKNSSNNGNDSSNSVNALANRDANAAAAAEGLGLSMDELSEILWTPADNAYWERVNVMVTRFGLCKTLGVTLADVRPGRVEVVMPFRAEVSGEGGSFHASLIPTLIAMTSQLAGMTLLPRHFTLKPIDFKCNILSDCDASTYLLVSRGAVVVRGDHSITVKIEILKASGLLSGSTDIITSPNPSLSRSASFSWKSWAKSSTPVSPTTNNNSPDLVPGTGIERSKFVVCASGMQTSVVVRAGPDQNDDEENEIQRLKRQREQSLKRSSSSSSGSGAAYSTDDVIVLGDSFLPSARPATPRPLSPTTRLIKEQPPHSLENNSFEVVSPSSSYVAESLKGVHFSNSSTAVEVTTATATTSSIPSSAFSYASAVRSGLEDKQPHQEHLYEESSDTEAWRM